ncbi:hypothetical protein VTN77DRAFT_2528 [Rasamsonia byssochlamydoides]|uniref:uncharacterized protein n=1 Tax=Rasamsonia byssochlamydoides TaxID=89139 RepID=UPI003743FEFA
MSGSLTNYIAYVENSTTNVSRIGHLDTASGTIQPLSFVSGTPLRDLYQVIAAGDENIIPGVGESPIPLDSVKILPVISGRDILAVGKNYPEHATEFNRSGYDSSDKVDQPSHPVIFTKRATSIIAHGDPILPHPEFTKTLDYEGEIGVIIGKAGFQIPEADAWDYVWGYTIINDVTAREKQRDHKQFFIGKSADSFAPIGPIAVPASHLPKTLRVQTFVNGQQRQDGNTDQLIFSIPTLIHTLSEGQTLQPGDVIATGTPAGVGFGQNPPTFLQPGDEVEVRVTGLGSLRNKVAPVSTSNSTLSNLQKTSPIPTTNLAKSVNGVSLTQINGKALYYQTRGSGSPIVFIHGLGGSSEHYTPLISALSLDKSHTVHLLDLEGHGLSPTSALSALSIESFAADIKGVFDHAGITSSSGATLVGHSMGCLIALHFVLQNPGLVKKLILLGPPPNPLPEAASKGSIARAALVREKGMAAVVDAVATAATSEATKSNNPVAMAAVRLSLLSQDPEAYAKACQALAGATTAFPLDKVDSQTLVVTGDEDKVSPPAVAAKYASTIPNSQEAVVLEGVGHWHIFEDVQGVANAVKSFI